LRGSLLALLLLVAAGAQAQEDKLVSGPGSTLTENKCKICHELQHIRRQPLSRGEWSDNLRNMKERGTPMTEAEMAVILDYLALYYNREKPAPPPSVDTLASANPMQKLLDSHACSGCHRLDERVVGPSFQEIAGKYNATAMSSLIKKVREGGKGTWGSVPMPPNPGVSEADARTLVGWILQQRK
jgi:cytochrome c551/c552